HDTGPDAGGRSASGGRSGSPRAGRLPQARLSRRGAPAPRRPRLRAGQPARFHPRRVRPLRVPGAKDRRQATLTDRAMIRPGTEPDLPARDAIINEGAEAYRGVIPADCWHEPYMPRSELLAEIADGVEFLGWDDAGVLAGVMGLQKVHDVTLIRHAYVR